MLAAGLSAQELSRELSAAKSPIAQCRPSSKFWRGVLSTRSLQERLRSILPETFEELRNPLGVGVYDAETGEPRLITSGPLIPAVAASCAVPGGMFEPVRLDDGKLYADGGALDRTFVRAWREWSRAEDEDSGNMDGDRKALVHLIKDSQTETDEFVYSKRDGIPEHEDRDDLITIVHSPRTQGSLFHLGDFEAEREFTCAKVTTILNDHPMLL